MRSKPNKPKRKRAAAKLQTYPLQATVTVTSKVYWFSEETDLRLAKKAFSDSLRTMNIHGWNIKHGFPLRAVGDGRVIKVSKMKGVMRDA